VSKNLKKETNGIVKLDDRSRLRSKQTIYIDKQDAVAVRRLKKLTG